MALVCTAAGVAAAAVDYDRLSDRELQVVIAYLMAQAAGITNNAKQNLASAYAAGYAALSDREIQMAQLYLFCQAAGGT